MLRPFKEWPRNPPRRASVASIKAGRSAGLKTRHYKSEEGRTGEGPPSKDGGYTRMTTLHCVEERSLVAALLGMTTLRRVVNWCDARANGEG